MRAFLFSTTCIALVGIAIPSSAKSIHHVARKADLWDVSVEQPQFSGKTKVQRGANALCASIAKMMFNDFHAMAKRDARRQDHGILYTMDSQFSTTHNGGELVSGNWSTYTYTGGAHGMTFFRTVNVGWHWGEVKELDIPDLFLPGVDGYREARFVVLQHLRANERANWVQDGDFMLTNELLDNFVVSRKGITWLFEPYAVGSYASGSFAVTVPFREIFGLDPAGPLEPVWRGNARG